MSTRARIRRITNAKPLRHVFSELVFAERLVALALDDCHRMVVCRRQVSTEASSIFASDAARTATIRPFF